MSYAGGVTKNNVIIPKKEAKQSTRKENEFYISIKYFIYLSCIKLVRCQWCTKNSDVTKHISVKQEAHSIYCHKAVHLKSVMCNRFPLW